MERRKSGYDRAKRADRIERARRMKPEDRLLAGVNLSSLGLELQRAGARARERARQNSRP